MARTYLFCWGRTQSRTAPPLWPPDPYIAHPRPPLPPLVAFRTYFLKQTYLVLPHTGTSPSDVLLLRVLVPSKVRLESPLPAPATHTHTHARTHARTYTSPTNVQFSQRHRLFLSPTQFSHKRTLFRLSQTDAPFPQTCILLPSEPSSPSTHTDVHLPQAYSSHMIIRTSSWPLYVLVSRTYFFDTLNPHTSATNVIVMKYYTAQKTTQRAPTDSPVSNGSKSAFSSVFGATTVKKLLNVIWMLAMHITSRFHSALTAIFFRVASRCDKLS